MNIANQRTYYTCIVVHMGQTGSSIQSWSANLIKGGACKRGLKNGSQKPGPVRCLMDTPAADERWVGFWLSLRQQQQLQLLLNSPSLQTPLLTLETLNQNKTPPTLSLLQKKQSLMLLIYTPLLVITKVTTTMMHIVDHINATICKWASNPKIILVIDKSRTCKSTQPEDQMTPHNDIFND